MTTNGSGTLIRLDGVKKVFYTDEVETHALDGALSRSMNHRCFCPMQRGTECLRMKRSGKR